MKSKGQIEITELLLITLFVVAILVAAMFFFAGFQKWQFDAEKDKERVIRAVGLMKRLTDSPLLNDENSMFSDKKLLAIGRDCKSLQDVFGRGWFMEIRILDSRESVECGKGNYDSCNYYSLCKDLYNSQQLTAFDLPVNVKKSIGNQSNDAIFTYSAIAKMKLGVYD
ncbi:MAG: hypothetical protein HYX24_05805 [Candidatus Aenigmarchaeota archaeon]|nr:hypothetical protein [Candidatus Aenigmarchaeota archaeon]